MSVSELAQDQITSEHRQTGVEELDEGKVEALQWLQTQLIWERLMANLRSRAGAESQNGSAAVGSELP